MKNTLILSQSIEDWDGFIYKVVNTAPPLIVIKNRTTKHVDYPYLQENNNLIFYEENKVNEIGKFLSYHLCMVANHLEKIQKGM